MAASYVLEIGTAAVAAGDVLEGTVRIVAPMSATTIELTAHPHRHPGLPAEGRAVVHLGAGAQPGEIYPFRIAIPMTAPLTASTDWVDRAWTLAGRTDRPGFQRLETLSFDVVPPCAGVDRSARLPPEEHARQRSTWQRAMAPKPESLRDNILGAVIATAMAAWLLHTVGWDAVEPLSPWLEIVSVVVGVVFVASNVGVVLRRPRPLSGVTIQLSTDLAFAGETVVARVDNPEGIAVHALLRCTEQTIETRLDHHMEDHTEKIVRRRVLHEEIRPVGPGTQDVAFSIPPDALGSSDFGADSVFWEVLVEGGALGRGRRWQRCAAFLAVLPMLPADSAARTGPA